MKLPHEFIQLPYRFDVARLQQEVLAFDETQWVAHPDGFTGNSSLPLVSVKGEVNNEFCGPMLATQALLSAPYLQQVIASLGQVVGRSRLMRLAPGTEVPVHTDTNYHWYKRVRIHIPIITDSGVTFFSEQNQVNMQAGDTWIFDSWKYHSVSNQGSTLRVHLVIDTHGSPEFWHKIKTLAQPIGQQLEHFSPQSIPFRPERTVSILTEKYNASLIMHPGEVDYMVSELLVNIQQHNPNKVEQCQRIGQLLTDLSYQWKTLWSLYGDEQQGWMKYQQVRQQAFQFIKSLPDELNIDNGTSANTALIYCLIEPLINIQLSQ
ncbi:aspartyl/asparaginyl beta-hydroxylase domain-containing protein [Paraglaciecola hydrolytica]|uniref:Aspartyl/asparaginy/proline hydroxylase domain-containing protein n=1 Tax=Paraglaciecola hydrolytica TaxID=1799789 RepID=A0A136A5T1_9ALTE|nr:aspartyl/asparaginyl beta-hydroxylase domain-containing protein [Paraglaciecola hydrolytica]KXI30480.1 hypothetical protein AX660_10985 [Paraglaciecola hydrolytica]